MWSRLTLAGQFLVFQMGVIALVLVAVTVISVRQADVELRNDQSDVTRQVANQIGNLKVVQTEVDQVGAQRAVSPRVVDLQESNLVDLTLVADADGVVVASSDPTIVGARVGDGDAAPALDGRPWTGEQDVGGRRVLVSYRPVFRVAGGEFVQVGVAGAAVLAPTLGERLPGVARNTLLYLGIAAGLGVAGSYLLSRLVRRRTRGLEPAQIATLADHREALLHSIREGVVGVGTDGRVTVLNDGARDLLGLPADAVGRHVDDLALHPALRSLLLSAEPARDAVVVADGKALVVSRETAASEGRAIGTVTTVRDRTELVTLQSQLDVSRSVTDTLRAQTHEHANQLHTLSGLVQLEEYDELRRLVGDLTRRRAEISEAVTSMVDDPAVAALLVAKTSSALESGQELALVPGSHLGRLSSAVSAAVTTVVGNLVDNALHASADSGGRHVDVHLADDGDEVVVEVNDDGAGVPEPDADRVFERGFSTKPDSGTGRGVGLSLVRVLCASRGGSVTVENGGELGGAVFTATLPHREEAGA
ncbi:ATP-binding protein [Nocardioides sp. CFH 31398]|uniref:sensor histidine kinase n=1 Tax=Nocardioides sp. CFH 31398 TaxID=2919579 RepID=UPI001F06704D|nr:ATP-binding protein [Nocardioides sp. CFH 31398]MCH1868041.1 ATP-binding protein [Nocardioides sp. CFH 31398]